MFVWIPSPIGGIDDPLGTDNSQQKLLKFCSDNGVNVIFLDMYNYLGGATWSSANQVIVKKFIAVARASGIRVMALCGADDWAQKQSWVLTNIVRTIASFNAMSEAPLLAFQKYKKFPPNTNTTIKANDVLYAINEAISMTYTGGAFDGVMLDVEYWTLDPYDASTEVPGLCDLITAMRRILNIPVGCFTTDKLMDPSQAQNVTYRGITQIEGQHLMDSASFVCVACYSNNSVAQIGMFNPWYLYASQSGRNCGLWCCSETGDDPSDPSGASTYKGFAKTDMEANHTAISNNFTVPSNSVFRGQAIDPYSAYLQMS
jgi:hypothetical protein